MDVVYILGGGSILNDNEIRFSLRSVEKHLKNYGDIYVIGHLPHFLKDIWHSPAIDRFDMVFGKSRNIMEKIKIACNIEHLSEDFILFNDDHILTEDIDCRTFPYYKSSSYLDIVLGRKDSDIYKCLCLQTQDAIKNFQYFDVHAPIIYNKKRFVEIMDSYNWQNLGYLIKSLYCCNMGIEGVETEDFKISSLSQIDRKPLFSFDDRLIDNELLSKMQELYPEKSRYEV